MKYNTLIKDIKKRKLWVVIIYLENADNHANIFYYLYDFELYIKARYQNQERFVDFTLTYIREKKELRIWGSTPKLYQREEVNL